MTQINPAVQPKSQFITRPPPPHPNSTHKFQILFSPPSTAPPVPFLSLQSIQSLTIKKKKKNFRSNIKMATRSLPLLLLILLSTICISSSSPSSSDLVSELQSLQSASPSNIIHLNDRLVSRFLTSPPSPRPYSLLIFFDSSSLRSNPDLHLPHLLSQFSLVSRSFSSHHQNLPSSSLLFFCLLDFSESQSSFSQFAVSSLPHIRLVLPSSSPLSSSLPLDSSSFPRLPEALSQFILSKTKLSVGPILHPPAISPRRQLLILAVSLLAAPFIIKKILSGRTPLHDSRVWMAGAVVVYFFSVSGSMHNIIRNMPMMMSDREGRAVFFYQGSGMQLGAEGLIVGSLYTLVGLVVGVVTHGLVRLRSRMVQRWLMLVGMVLVYWAVGKVIGLDNWKTGYRVHAFWPSRWK